MQREVNVTVCAARIGTDVGQCGVERAGDAIALARGADIDLRRRPAGARPAGAGARLAGARPAGTRSSRFGEVGDLGHRGVDRAGDAIALALGADLDLSAEARPRPVTRCRQIKPLR